MQHMYVPKRTVEADPEPQHARPHARHDSHDTTLTFTGTQPQVHYH
jgi:hypothetical protein